MGPTEMAGTMNAEQKARQRARNKAAGNAPTRSGSSGSAAQLLNMERKTWAELEAIADHVADIGGLLYSSQNTANGTTTLQVGVPMEYIHDVADLVVASRTGAVFFRAYVVTPESMMRELAAGDGGGAGARELLGGSGD